MKKLILTVVIVVCVACGESTPTVSPTTIKPQTTIRPIVTVTVPVTRPIVTFPLTPPIAPSSASRLTTTPALATATRPTTTPVVATTTPALATTTRPTTTPAVATITPALATATRPTTTTTRPPTTPAPTTTTRPTTTTPAPTTTTRPTTTTPAPTTTTRPTTTTPAPANPVITSDSLSLASMVLVPNINSNAVYWTVNITDSSGKLPATAGAQLCAPGSSPGIGPWCTGATMGRSGTAFAASYTGLFLVSNSADRGSWYPSVFWPVGQAPEYQIAGTARISIR